jgi:molybdopterin-guanine dinucleotide biosynthesis protein A
VSSARLLGVVLAGGEGRRFGGSKADQPVAGVSMVRRAVSSLSQVVDRVVIVSSRPVADAPVEVLADATPGAGPLGGLQTALETAEDRGLDGAFVLACDLPLVDVPLLERLRDALGDEHIALAPQRRGGGVEPLCAIYRVDARAAVAERLRSDDRSLHALFRDLGGVALGSADLGATAGEAFLNVNTPADLVRAEAALQARRTRP